VTQCWRATPLPFFFYLWTFLIPTHPLIPSVRVPTSRCVLLCYTLNAQLFLQPLPVPRSENMFLLRARISQDTIRERFQNRTCVVEVVLSHCTNWFLGSGLVVYKWITADGIIYVHVCQFTYHVEWATFWQQPIKKNISWASTQNCEVSHRTVYCLHPPFGAFLVTLTALSGCSVRSEVLWAALLMKIVFWDVTPCSWAVRHFEGFVFRSTSRSSSRTRLTL
jgi:hypothetical protein